MTLVEIAREWKNGNRNLEEEIRNLEIYHAPRAEDVLDTPDPGFGNPNSFFESEDVFDSLEEKHEFIKYVADIKGIEYK